MAEQRRASGSKNVVSVIFAFYALALAAIVFWPTPVDRDAGRFLGAITRRIPFLTYEVIEFIANIALFLPFGILLAMLLPAHRRLLVVPIALATTATIEVGQGALLDERTASVVDVAANTLGAVVGFGLVMLMERLFDPRRLAG